VAADVIVFPLPLSCMPCLCRSQLASLGSLPPIPSIPSGNPLGLDRLANAIAGCAPGGGLPAVSGSPSLAAGAAGAARQFSMKATAGVAIQPPDPHLDTARFISASLPPGGGAQLAATSMALSAFTGSGLTPAATGFSSKMGRLFASMNANLPALAPLSALALGPLLQLSSLASLVAMAPVLLGHELSAAGALANLRDLVMSRISAGGAFSPSVNFSGQTLAKAANSMGVNLAAPGGIAQWASAVRVAGALALPALSMPLLQLTHVAGVLGSLANINAGFGVNLLEAGAGSRLGSLMGQLPLGELGKLGVSLPQISAPSASMQLNPSLNLAGALPSGLPVGASGAIADLVAAVSRLNGPAVRDLSMTGSMLRSLSGLGIQPVNSPCAVCKIL
jgi:hypothetical protein